MEKINLKINGLEVVADKGQTILDVAKTNGIFIPTLCNDERIKPFGSCLLCRVEVVGARGNMLACATPVTEGMEVTTESDSINKARKMCLELLVSQHYGDCVAPCSLTCPAQIDVQGYIAHVANGEYVEAVKLIKQRNPLPLVCGRVCTRPCEDECRRNLVDERVGIDYLKRFVSDYDLYSDKPYVPETMPKSGKKAAVIGAGPSGISCANYLAIFGHDVTIFEKWPTGGGMLRFGIPEYRLPREPLEKEINLIKELGVEIKYNTVFGRDFTYDDLKAQGYDAVFLGVGSQAGQPLGLEHEDAEGVMTGVGFLGRVNVGEKIDFTGKKVIVIGGGNTALDASRTSTRLNADEVVLAYRRTKAEMPAHEIEVEEAEFEGVKLELLAAPKRVIVENNKVAGLEFIRMKLGEADASGRRKPEEVPGSEYIIKADIIIAAIGQTQDLSFINDKFNIGTQRNRIVADKELMTTTLDGVFAGGDAVTGPDAAIAAIAAGRRAAVSMNQYLMGVEIKKPSETYNHVKGMLKDINAEEYKDFEKITKIKMPLLSKDQRKNNFNEVELGFNEEMAKEEAKRCLSCGCKDVNECKLREYTSKYEVNQDRFAGRFEVLPIDESHQYIAKDPNKCITCGLCVRICTEQQGAGVLGFNQRGYNTVITASFDMPFGEDKRCENCGQCVSACPVGALTEKTNLSKPGPFVEATTNTTCYGCSTGCTIVQNVAGNGNTLVRTTSQVGVGVNNGNLCERGRFGNTYKTMKNTFDMPKIRENGEFKTVSLEEALNFAADHICKLAKANGNDSVAVIVTPDLTNEELIAAKNLAQEVIKTTSLGSGKISKASMAIQKAMDIGTGKATYANIANADLIITIGFDIKETNPVAAISVKNAAENGTKLIVLADKPTKTSKFATIDKVCDNDELSNILTNHSGLVFEALSMAKSPLFIIHDDTSAEHVTKTMELLKVTGHDLSNLLLMHDNCNMRGLIEVGLNMELMNNQYQASILFTTDKQEELKLPENLGFKVAFTANDSIDADVIIPISGLAQLEGSYTNSEGSKGTVNISLNNKLAYTNEEILQKLSNNLANRL